MYGRASRSSGGAVGPVTDEGGYLCGLLGSGFFGLDTLYSAGGHVELLRYGSDMQRG